MGLLPEEELIALDLLSEEICYLISNHRYTAHELKNIEELVPRDQLDLIKDEPKDRLYAQLLFSAACRSPLKNALYQIILVFLARVDSAVHSCLTLCNHFGDYLRHVPHFLEFVDPLDPFEDLMEQSIPLRESLTVLKEEFQKGTMSEQRYKRCLLRLIPETGNVSVDRFLFHMYTSGNESAKRYIDQVKPNFERYYKWRYSDSVEQIGVVTFVPEFVDIATAFDDEKMSKWGLTVDLMSQRISLYTDEVLRLNTGNSSSDHEGLFESHETVELRAYQKELAAPALRKQNCIICAPTGSGKTIVAGHIISTHLKERILKERTIGRACFVVPNIPLLEQQKKVCQKFLGMNAKISIIRGDSKVPLVHTIRNSHVVLLTPQMLVNALQSTQRNSSNLESDEFRLTMFSLIVLDECHHTNENHPYNKLMEFYHDMKMENSMSERESLPQIVGLTASLGVGSSKSAGEAVEYIIKLCANLDAVVVSTVNQNVDDLTHHSAENRDEIHLMQSDYTKEAFFIGMINIMDEVECLILCNPEVRVSPQLTKALASDNVRDKLSAAYLQWISITLKSTLPEARCISDQARAELTDLFKLLKVLLRKLELWYYFDAESALKYYNERVYRLNVSEEISKIVADLHDGQHGRSEMLTSLFAQVFTFTRQGNDSRVMIFVKECEHASVLKDLILQNGELSALGVRSDYLISSGRSGDLSISNELLRSKIQQFKSGLTNVLCVTSVAEEGLDVCQCDLVVKYNYASNDIAHVQRRGRARQKNSQCVLFTCDNKLKQQEERNIACEKLAHSAIQFIQKQSAGWLREKVLAEINKNNKERNQLRALNALQEQRIIASGIVYDINCRQCNNVIGTSNNIYHVNNCLYLLCDKTIWHRCQWRASVCSKELDNPDIGQVLCEGCGEPWGRIILHKNVAVPTVSCKAIVLVDKEGTRRTVAKWKKIVENYFIPSEVTMLALALMRTATTPEFDLILRNGESAESSSA
ncbi:hypothetical protein QR680_001255 [Steinernema hermaphroditum]|uniref:RNA helicase n=1 Tax=Steinernema hermaphroditum TaxID=289476 RepID=A0AA39LFI8_9BILA|nr:hypothetical protein QR680_001255 [Steinernema hermaphroditum]